MQAALRIQSLIEEGWQQFEAWNTCSVQLVASAQIRQGDICLVNYCGSYSFGVVLYRHTLTMLCSRHLLIRYFAWIAWHSGVTRWFLIGKLLTANAFVCAYSFLVVCLS